MSRRLSSWPVERSVNGRSVVSYGDVVLRGLLVLDFTRYLPGPFASRELMRLGARVVRVETPDGDPLRSVAPGWDDALNAGKESVVWDRERDPELGVALCRKADVVLEGFRPGVAERLGIAAGDLPDSLVYCSVTGFGADDVRAGHDLNYVGWAGLLADTAPAVPPVQIADLAGGSLFAVVEILAALLERERSGHGRHIVLSMTHNAHRLVAHRLRSEPERTLTGGLACYRVYATADDRFLTVTPVEPKFWSRLCELIGRPDLVERQYEGDQEGLAAELAAVFSQRTLGEWVELFEGVDVMVGPVATLEEAAAWLGEPEATGRAPALGEHTEAWRTALAPFEG
jgi:alpha-methylacyl-CoA racemase